MGLVSREAHSLSPSIVHRLETGSGKVTVISLYRYAEALDLKLSDLLSFAVPAGEAATGMQVYGWDDPRAKKLAHKSWLPLYSALRRGLFFGWARIARSGVDSDRRDGEANAFCSTDSCKRWSQNSGWSLCCFQGEPYRAALRQDGVGSVSRNS